MQQTISAIQHAFSVSESPLILAHQRPDGDAIGSAVALGLALEQAGKKPQLVFSDGLPKKFRFLSGSERIRTGIESQYDMVVALDCANFERLSAPENPEKIHINIDHHVTNERFAEINFVLPDHAATASILATYLPAFGYEITPEIANALLMGMITDTIGFRTSNVNAEFLRLAAILLEKGADLVQMYQQGLTLHTGASSKVWGYALSRLEIDGKLAWTTILLEDRKRAEYGGMDDADLTNHLSSLENIDISILFNEQKDDKVKVSWRSSEVFDVTQIASLFGGGGHPRAAGANMDGALGDVIEKVLGETKKVMQGKNPIGR